MLAWRNHAKYSEGACLRNQLRANTRAYLTAHAGQQHERQFGWKTFRVLTVTTDQHRMRSMMEALRKLPAPHSPGAPLFFFTTRDELRAIDPLAQNVARRQRPNCSPDLA